MRSKETRGNVARAISIAVIASSTLCSRPRKRRSAIVERLHAERDAIDAGGAIAAEALSLDAGGVGFERDLDIGIDRPGPADRIEDRADRLRLHQRRRAAAEEDARHRAPGRPPGGRRDLAREGCGIALLVDRLMADMGVEVAIGAFGRAERPMDIDAEAGIGGVRHRPSR